MFEDIILITFLLWCVFGVLLLKNREWNFKKIGEGRIKG